MQFMLAINNILKGIKSILTKKKENLSGYGRLHGYGDLYEVRDLRKRGRKEPYELAANKNLVFKKINNWQNTYENFDHTLFNNEKYESVKVELINSKYFIKFNFFIAKIKDQNSPKKYRGNEYLIEKEVEKKDLHNIKNLNYVGGNFYSASILKRLYNSLKKEAFNDFLKLLDERVQNAKDNIIKEQNSSFGNKEYWVKRAEERLKEAEKERKYTLDYYNNNKDSELQDFDSQTLGKPTIKFEFENNEELKNFLKENKENLIESYIDVDEYQDNSKALNGYGDKYEVVDNRKRARKEPGELSATKNLEFTKVGKAAENYNKDAFNTEKFKKVVFIKEFDGTFIEFNLFVAQKKSDDKIESRNVKKGADGIFYNVSSFRTLIEAKNVDMYNISDSEPHKYQAYITLEKYDEFYNEALKDLFDYIQREINSVKEQIENFDKYQYLYYKDSPDKKKKEEKRLNEMLSAAEQKLKNNIAFYNYGYGDYSDDLGNAGDLYIVRDLRTRARKEPGETIANKNLNFVKIKDAKIENFNKELYENKTVFDFDRDFNEYKSVRIESKDNRNKIEFVFFLPTKRLKNLNENALGGRLITVGVDIDIQKAINIQINPYSNSNKPTLQRIEADARKTKEYNYYYIDNNSTKDYYGWITDKYYNQLRQNGFNKFYNDYINREERFYTDYQKKLLKSFYSNPQKFEIYQVSRFDNDFSKIDNKTRDSYVELLQNSALNGYGLDIYNCPLSMLDCKSMHPTYPHFDDYSQFIEKADNESTLFGYGFEKATLNTLRDTVLDNYQQVKELAKILKGETDLQTFFNIWYFLHEQIKYGLDAAGKEEIRTPARCWADRFNGVDCDCLAVFTAALLINLGYNPKFEIVAMNNNPNYEHIYVVVDGIVIDRVLPAFNERPKNITKTLTMDIPVYQLSGISGCKKSRLNGVTDDILSVTNYDSSVVAMNQNEDDFSKVVINLNTTAETENPLSNSDSVNNEYIYSAVPEADTKRSNKTAIGFFAIFSVLSIYALLKK